MLGAKLNQYGGGWHFVNVAGRSITDINDLVPTYPVRNAWRALQKSALVRERQRVTILATC